MLVEARNTLHRLGGAAVIPLWGKTFLSCLNVYDWEGHHPVVPELFLLPQRGVPFHPLRMWVYARMTLAGVSYLYGRRVRCELDPLLEALREELYTQPYSSIDWPRYRDRVADNDVLEHHHPIADGLLTCLGVYERFVPRFVRHAGVVSWLLSFEGYQGSQSNASGLLQERVYDIIKTEALNSDYVSLGSVVEAMHVISAWDHDGPDSELVRSFMAVRPEYVWMKS